MTQSEINRAVALTTGETIKTISQRGFSIEQPPEPDADELTQPNVVDWDALDAERSLAAA